MSRILLNTVYILSGLTPSQLLLYFNSLFKFYLLRERCLKTLIKKTPLIKNGQVPSMTSSQLMQICAWFKWSGLWKWFEKLVTLHVPKRYQLLCYYLKSLYFNNQYQVIVVQWEEGSSAHLKKGLYESPLLLMKALLSCCKRSLIIRTCNALTWKRDKIIKVSRTLFGWTLKKTFLQ